MGLLLKTKSGFTWAGQLKTSGTGEVTSVTRSHRLDASYWLTHCLESELTLTSSLSHQLISWIIQSFTFLLNLRLLYHNPSSVIFLGFIHLNLISQSLHILLPLLSNLLLCNFLIQLFFPCFLMFVCLSCCRRNTADDSAQTLQLRLEMWIWNLVLILRPPPSLFWLSRNLDDSYYCSRILKNSLSIVFLICIYLNSFTVL